MSTLNLDALGLQPDTEGQPAPAAPVAAPAAPQSVTGLPAQSATLVAPVAPEATPVAPEAEEEIHLPDGAENPDAVKALIQAERKAARDAYKRARDAEAQLAAITEASMPVEQRLAAVEQRAASAEQRATRLAVGMKHGLSLTFSEMLQGADEATMDSHAQAILAELGQRRTPAPAPGVTLGGGPTPPPTARPEPGQAHNNWLLAAINGQLGA